MGYSEQLISINKNLNTDMHWSKVLNLISSTYPAVNTYVFVIRSFEETGYNIDLVYHVSNGPLKIAHFASTFLICWTCSIYSIDICYINTSLDFIVKA